MDSNEHVAKGRLYRLLLNAVIELEGFTHKYWDRK